MNLPQRWEEHNIGIQAEREMNKMNLQWKGKREGKGRMLPRESRTQRKCNRKHDTRVGGILLTKDRLKG